MEFSKLDEISDSVRYQLLNIEKRSLALMRE